MTIDEALIRDITFNYIKKLDKNNVINIIKHHKGMDIQCTKEAYRLLSKYIFTNFKKEIIGTDIYYCWNDYKVKENDFFSIRFN